MLQKSLQNRKHVEDRLWMSIQRPIWHEMSTLAPLSDFSYNAIGSIFGIFIHNGSVKKTAKFHLCI